MPLRNITETLTGVVFFLIGLFFLLISIFISLAVPGEGSVVKADLVGNLIPMVVSLGFLEAGASVFRKGRASGAPLQDHPPGVIGTVSGIVGSLVKLIALVVFALIFLVFAIIILPDMANRPLALSSHFLILVIIYGAYVLIVRPLAIPVLRRFSTTMERRTLHHYTLTPSGIVIDYRITDLRDPEKKYRFPVSFDDVTDLRLLTPGDAKALAYDIGAMYLNYKFEESKQLALFLKGKIRRPSLILQPSSDYLSLFMKGSDFVYIMAFDNDDSSEVLRTFQASRTPGSGSTPLEGR